MLTADVVLQEVKVFFGLSLGLLWLLFFVMFKYGIYIAGILAHLHTIHIASLSRGPDMFQGVGQGTFLLCSINKLVTRVHGYLTVL